MQASKRGVAVLGASGLVGQRLVRLLLDHPLFELVALGGSQGSVGKAYAETTLHTLFADDLQAGSLPSRVARMVVQPSLPGAAFDCDLVFSALPTEAAREVEPLFARAGYAVVSNASAHRMDPDVPLVVPEVNHDHIKLIEVQRRRRGWNGCIVTNPNCSTIALTLALAPLHKAWGLEAVQVTTMQALSGAGTNGPSALSMLDNIIPYIAGEEEKLESEPCKLLGKLDEVGGETGITPLPLAISAMVNRVPVIHGHTECVAVKLQRPAEMGEIVAAWQEWQPLRQAGIDLPSAPTFPVVVTGLSDRPQPRLDRDLQGGMVSIVGRLRRDPILSYKFVVLGHNLDRGAAGGTLLLAELLHVSGLIDERRTSI